MGTVFAYVLAPLFINMLMSNAKKAASKEQDVETHLTFHSALYVPVSVKTLGHFLSTVFLHLNAFFLGQ